MDFKTGRLILSYQELDEFPTNYITKYGTAILELDLSTNKIKDFRFLLEIPWLQTLILDHNGIHSHIKFPEMPRLKTLWVNHNKITNLGMFVGMVVKTCPKLQYLSMMNNPAAPSYFNGGTYMQYKDYREYVISQIPELLTLDDTAVSLQERDEALRLYAKHLPSPASSQSRKKSQRKKSASKNKNSAEKDPFG